MKKQSLILVVMILGVCSCAASDHIQTSRVNSWTEGEKSEDVAGATEQRMKEMIIPRLYLTHPNINTAVDFLMEVSRVLEPDRQEIEIVVSLPCIEHATFVERTPSPNDEWGPGKKRVPLCGAGHALPRTINMRRISVYDALKDIVNKAGLIYRIDDSGVVFIECGRFLNDKGSNGIENGVYEHNQ